jgi:hypothetical protein
MLYSDDLAREKVLRGTPAHDQVRLRKASGLILPVSALCAPHEPDESRALRSTTIH